jgi:hypothetical protein
MARETLNSTENVRIVVLSWGFSIIALFLQQKPLNAIETIDELTGYMRDVESRPLEEPDPTKGHVFTGADYDLCGIEKVISKRVRGATSKILQALILYLKGDADIEHIARANAEESDAIALEDVLVEESAAGAGPAIEEYPDFETISDLTERGAIERIDGIVQEFAGELGFQSFGFMFEEYDWNQDRGPAPFLEELLNRFFVEIVNGQVTRLSIDLDTLAAALLPDDQKEARATAATYAQAGAIFRFIHLEDLFITASKLSDIVEAMRAASFGEGKEIALYVNVKVIPDLQEDLISLGKIDEITEIDEIPVDYQEEGKRVVGSMVWTATR